MNKDYLLSLLAQIKTAEQSGTGKLPQNSFFLDYDHVVCGRRKVGDSRYPYEADGMMIWLHSNGLIDALESNFTIFKTMTYGEESPVNFFGGIKAGDEFVPVSLVGDRGTDGKNVRRYILYTLKCAYCFVEIDDCVFVLRLHVSEDKRIHFSLCAINTGAGEQEVYLASFIDAMLRYYEHETLWSRMSKYSKHFENGSFILMSKNDLFDALVINSRVDREPTARFATCTKSDALGLSGVAVANAPSLKVGKFERQVQSINTGDLPMMADMLHFTLPAGESVRVEYDLNLVHCENEADTEKFLNDPVDFAAIDADLEALQAAEKADFDTLKIRFEDWNSDKTDADTFSKFLRTVQKQVNICAHGKNYAGSYIGIRDVFQQLEGSLMWQSHVSRKKILIALDTIHVTGRPPRQFTLPASPDASVQMDMRKFIDQGVWIISTVYTYLTYTGDYSILDEECGYLDCGEDVTFGWAWRSKVRDSVLCHLKKIMAYLLSCVDEQTGCLRAMYGDWNDALDGMGKTKDEGKDFGSGVTVMGTLQLYQNLREMSAILRKIGDPEAEDLCKTYAAASARMVEGLTRYAIDVNDAGERRVIHGWGDKMGYKVGSFNDPDGKARYSLTANSFWAISKFLQNDPSMKASIMGCMDAVVSKYGLKTFDKPFVPENVPEIGRLARIMEGTYENCCAYAHGSLFGTMALFEMGESRRAWEEMEKTAVIIHDNCTLTTFAMPNSYCYNEQYGMDGESMGDWHTGSGTVLMKETVRYGFGILPTLDGVRIQFPTYFPARRGEISIRVKNTTLTLSYEKTGAGKRTVQINGATAEENFDELMGITTYFLPEESMEKAVNIAIVD